MANPVTTDTIVTIQNMVADLVTKKDAADVATNDANSANSAAAQAASVAAQANLTEAAADAAAASSLQDLQHFVDGLAAHTMPAPAPTL